SSSSSPGPPFSSFSFGGPPTGVPHQAHLVRGAALYSVAPHVGQTNRGMWASSRAPPPDGGGCSGSAHYMTKDERLASRRYARALDLLPLERRCCLRPFGGTSASRVSNSIITSSPRSSPSWFCFRRRLLLARWIFSTRSSIELSSPAISFQPSASST